MGDSERAAGPGLFTAYRFKHRPQISHMKSPTGHKQRSSLVDIGFPVWSARCLASQAGYWRFIDTQQLAFCLYTETHVIVGALLSKRRPNKRHIKWHDYMTLKCNCSRVIRSHKCHFPFVIFISFVPKRELGVQNVFCLTCYHRIHTLIEERHGWCAGGEGGKKRQHGHLRYKAFLKSSGQQHHDCQFPTLNPHFVFVVGSF